jgi:GNAT superfamily N-acetyltransferase
MNVRPARVTDVPRLPDIEYRAALRFLDHDLPQAASFPVQTVEALSLACAESRLLVAVDDHDQAIGFALLQVHEDRAHLQELDVDPNHKGRGLGRALLAGCVAWGRARRLSGLTLTTFRDIPFNAPFYARVGFVPYPDGAEPASLTAELRGFGIVPRVAMVLRWEAP